MKQLFLFSLTLLLLACRNPDSDYTDPRGTDYAGAESCVQCHQSTSENAMHSAHFMATAAASTANVLGNFSSGHNTFIYDENTKMVMEKRHDSLFQVLYKNNKEVAAYSFDIVFGGVNAQTAVYWHNRNTYELPISYYKAADNWGTSPDYSAKVPYFERMAVKDCYACHSSNIEKKSGKADQQNSFMTMQVEDVIDKNAIVYGIDCERCHGPAKKHVDYHLKFPDTKIAHEIVQYKSLTNQQKLDACAICHSGSNGIKLKSRFDFKPGDNLSDYYRKVPSSNYDVHGNQAGLLSQSQCFIQSKTLNCITCHNPHNATKNPTSYASICINCHKAPEHKNMDITIESLKENCINCHMPKQSSDAINFQVSGNPEVQSYKLRTHKIAVYPKEKKKN
ncbi:MAG: multiheme c-type cytochrome [Flavobacterium sp.]|nr:multiheme c-type cytochrome [Flavobacterium sp.]